MAIEYGRLATSAVGGGARDARGSRIASPQWSVTLPAPSQRVGERRLQAPVQLDGVHPGRRPRQGHGQHAQARADLQHHVGGAHGGLADREVDQVLVEQEVLAEVRVGPDAVRGQAPHHAEALARGRRLRGRRSGRRWRW